MSDRKYHISYKRFLRKSAHRSEEPLIATLDLHVTSLKRGIWDVPRQMFKYVRWEKIYQIQPSRTTCTTALDIISSHNTPQSVTCYVTPRCNITSPRQQQKITCTTGSFTQCRINETSHKHATSWSMPFRIIFSQHTLEQIAKDITLQHTVSCVRNHMRYHIVARTPASCTICRRIKH